VIRALTRAVACAVVAALVAACATPGDEPSDAVRNAIAPTGTLRVGLISVPVHTLRDPYSGELRGVSHDLGRELAARLGVPFEPIVYPNPAAYVAAGQAGRWDVGSLGLTAERMAWFDLASPHLDVDHGYLVPAGSPVRSIDDVDQHGVRVAMVADSASDSVLAGRLRHASVVRGRDLSALIDLVAIGDADVIAAQKTNLFNIAPRLPGSLVLDGRPGSEAQALAIPKGRDARALAYLQAFVDDAKRQGLVQRAIDRVGLRGVQVHR
jgi:polar amino acid transport system substrate-binding protein